MMRILVLGHNGMLGNAVAKFVEEYTHYKVCAISERFPDIQFEQAIQEKEPDVIVNGIGIIPQKKPTEEQYRVGNIDLPKFLDTLNIPVIHPTTDCEFSGMIPSTQKYQKDSQRDAEDVYGKSKREAAEWIEKFARNTKMIRTSIIGHEQNSSYSLLDWLLSQTGSVGGYTDHYWNGITTLEWAKQCIKIFEHWSDASTLTQLATEPCVSKYELLKIIADVYQKNITVNPVTTGQVVNKCLASDLALEPIREQLQSLKVFYKR